MTPALPRAWRYVRFGEPRAPWREVLDQALIDALEDGQATEAWWSPHPISITWPGEIEATADAVVVEPRSLKRRRRRIEPVT